MINRRGLFGLVVGAGAAVIIPMKAETLTPVEEGGSGYVSVKWVGVTRGMGFFDTASGKDVFFNAQILRQSRLELRDIKMGKLYFVRWKETVKGRIATAVL